MSRSGPSRGQRLAGAVVVSALLLATAGFADADDPGAKKKKVDGQIAATGQDLDGVSRDLTSALKTLSDTTKKVGTARTTLTNAQNELNAANRYNTDIGGKLKVAQADETKNQKALAGNKKAQNQTKVLVGGLARQSYMQGGMGRLELTLNVLTSGNADVADNLSLADIVLRQQNGVLGQLSGQQAAGTATANRLGAIRSQIADLKRKAASGVTRATTARDNASKAKSSLESLQRTQTTAAANLKKKKDKETSDLLWLKGESTRLQGVLDARAKARAAAVRKHPTTATPAPPRGINDGHFLTGPMPKSRIISPFGYRMHPVLHVWMLHAGDDFPFACGTPVLAAAAGDVIEARSNSIDGTHVIIDHGTVGGVNLATQYDHLSRIVVSSGHVAKGQVIGISGTTGRSTGCHLHFALYRNGKLSDPAPYIG